MQELVFKKDWPVPDEVMLEIGRISVQWNSLENLLTICIGKLAGFDVQKEPASFVMVNHSSFPQKIDIFSSLCELLCEDYPKLKDYKEAVSAIKIAQKRRNKYIHNTITHDKKSDIVHLSSGTARGKLKISITPLDLSDLKETIRDIHEANRLLTKIVLGLDFGTFDERSAEILA
jgi:hypothetical protein